MRCRVCNSENVNYLGKIGKENYSITSDSLVYNKQAVAYYCKQCGHIQKFYDYDLNEVYQEYNPHHLSGGNEQLVFPKGESPKSRSYYCMEKILGILPDKGKALDVGTGNGASLKTASLLLDKYELYGNDIVDIYEKEIMKINNVKQFICGDITQIKTQQFDFISLWNVLEHIDYPSQMLECLYDKLTYNGYLFLQVPDIERNPFDLSVIDHVSHFTKEGLICLLENVGFEVAIDGSEWVWNSITVLVRKSNKKKNRQAFQHSNAERIFTYLNNSINYFQREIKDENYYIFGTGMSSIFMYSQFLNKPNYFIDEDVNKINNDIENIKIITPDKIDHNYKIVMPFKKKAAYDLKDKLIKTYKLDCCKFVIYDSEL